VVQRSGNRSASVRIDRPVNHVAVAAGIAATGDVGTRTLELEEWESKTGRNLLAASAVCLTVGKDSLGGCNLVRVVALEYVVYVHEFSMPYLR